MNRKDEKVIKFKQIILDKKKKKNHDDSFSGVPITFFTSIYNFTLFIHVFLIGYFVYPCLRYPCMNHQQRFP